jgi:type II secretory pathway pseudopilin PulG
MTKKNNNFYKGFTLVEVIVSSALVITALAIIAQTYMSIIKSVIFAQSLQANLDSVHFGLEKIWNEVKSGSNFPTSTIATTSLSFKDRRCRNITIELQPGGPLLYKIDNYSSSSLFDEKLVQVNNFIVFFDTSTNPNPDDYRSYSKKIVNFYFDLSLKAGDKVIPYQINLSVAPILSPISQNKPCR